MRAGPLLAADLRIPSVGPYNWSGFYVGVHAGYGFASARQSVTAGGTVFQTAEDLDGALAGFQAGANTQLGPLVLGLEGDFGWSWQSNRFNSGASGVSLSLESEIPWLATLRGSDEGARLLRLAYAANPHDRWIAFALADAMYASLPQAVAKGRDRRAALLTILKLRPDHVETLRALWRLEQEMGNAAEAERYRSQLTAVSPLDRGVRVKTGEE